LKANGQYLTAELADLRMRLEKMIASYQLPSQPPPEKKHGLFSGGWSSPKPDKPSEEPEPEVVLPTDGADSTGMEKSGMSSALMVLAERLKLSRFEQQVLLLCAAVELDTRIPLLCARAQDDLHKTYPTFALALALFDEPVWNALSPHGPLRYWRLIEINQPGATPLTASALRADERIVNYLKGLNYLDDRLAPFVEPLFAKAGIHELPPSQEQQANDITARLQVSSRAGRTALIELLGKDDESKRAVAQRVAAKLGRKLYRLSADRLPSQWSEIEDFSRLWKRESLLLPLALYLDLGGDSAASETQKSAVYRLLTPMQGVQFLAVEAPQGLVERPTYTVEIRKPSSQEQQFIWSWLLGDDVGDLPQRLAVQFNLNQQEIEQIAAALPCDEETGVISEERLWEACLAVSRPRLERLAQRIDAKATWDDIVLPEEDQALLRQIAQQVRQRSRVYEEWGFSRKMNRGMGISALFAGESGTGKTMAAEVIANELKLHLYRIDLSAVVNKYIGETEKNLRRVFDAAEDSGAILFFDEADALFGKRSEVKDSHDRYANIEINYLLQRMEAYRGLAILATNMKSALDQAFMRRLRFIVNFPFPGVKERKRMWETVFPRADDAHHLGGTPLEQLNYDQLAKLSLTGGSIHNIALNAAFLAAQAGTNVTMALVLEAARTEFRKLEKPVNEADFRLVQSVGARG
jgi:hypothetical protein